MSVMSVFLLFVNMFLQHVILIEFEIEPLGYVIGGTVYCTIKRVFLLVVEGNKDEILNFCVS